MVTFWCPAQRVTLWHLGACSHNLPFLPFTDFWRVCITHSQCNYSQYNSDTDSGKGGQSVGAKVWVAVTMGLISRGWDGATLATRYTPVGALRNQVPELHGNGRLALVQFNSRFIIVSYCGNGKVYVVLGNYLWKLLLPEHAKCKRQASVRDCTKSTRQRFQTQDVSYLERHLTTRPHETSQLYGTLSA